MKEAAQSSHLASFDSFEVNLHSQELRQNGNRIKIPGQSFRILAMLLERPGELVTRQEIQDKLWPQDTVVEFENSINAAIKKLRSALSDSADEPRYIETLARRGYRWLVPVRWLPGRFASTEALPARGVTGAISKWRRWPHLIAGAATIAASVLASGYFLVHRTPRLSPSSRVVLGEFTNSTGDPVFDGTLRQGLVAQLEQSPRLVILSDEQIEATMRLMSQPPGSHLTRDLARQVCRRNAGTAVLDGSIAQVGNRYQIILSAVDCSTGARLASVQQVAGDKNHVLGALGSAAASIRAKLGESVSSIQRFNTPLEAVTTSSLEALQAYSVGWQANLGGDEAAAAVSFERAISLDPAFAMAYAALSTARSGLGESGPAITNIQKAYDLRDRVSERERFYIASHYEENATGDLEKSNQILILWAQSYPSDVVPLGQLGFNYQALGNYQEALVVARHALVLAPDQELPYEVLASSYLCLGEFQEVAAAIQKANNRGIDSPPFHQMNYGLAFLAGKAPEMAREVAWAAGKPGTEDVLIDFEATTTSYTGRLADAYGFTKRAADSARHAGAQDRAAGYLAEAGLRYALVGDAARARTAAESALKVSSDSGVQAASALALALAGNTARAEQVAEELAKRRPQDTVAQFHYLPTVRAAIALRQKSPAKALAELQTATAYEFGTPFIYFALCPAYVRGLAYLAAGDGTRAVPEFEKILDHQGISLSGPGPLRALAHLQIGRAYAVQGDTRKAKAAYQEFLAIWKDADPDLPVLITARNEYANLR